MCVVEGEDRVELRSPASILHMLSLRYTLDIYLKEGGRKSRARKGPLSPS